MKRNRGSGALSAHLPKHLLHHLLLDRTGNRSIITPTKGGNMPCMKRGVKKAAKKTAKKKTKK
ncbi:hypothetical protein FJY68_02730 [candidate division WOR-3 bacterium]|uniref:Uncharacterized protein n=1 Tax=candidate division WOR-3 bacterium TaxID=2052148 RepID=A0A937XES4_UNCW3|nr:hypothetical protein [candidate division WOR-3 bacterium]